MTEPSNRRPTRTAGRRPARPLEQHAAHHRRTRQEHSLETAQDYVEAIADLIASLGEARAVDLARRLGVSHVTVIRTVERLQREGYVTTQPYRAIFLTRKGAKLAAECQQRHAIVVQFLLALGVSEANARTDAEGLEHHVSAETLEAFNQFLQQQTALVPPKP